MKFYRSLLLVMLCWCFASAELIIHIYNPWVENPYRLDSIYAAGYTELGYHPGTKMQPEGNGWFLIELKATILQSDKIEFVSYIGNQYDAYALRAYFPRHDSTTTAISLYNLRNTYPSATDLWIIPSDSSKTYKIYSVPPSGKVIHLMNPWPDNSPQILVGGMPARKMLINTEHCGWYTYYFSGFVDSLKKVYFTDYFHKFKYGTAGINSPIPLDLTGQLAEKDTIYILPKPFPAGPASITSTFPGKTGECPTRKVSAIVRDWKLDGISFTTNVTGGKLVTGMVASQLDANGKPVKGANATAGRGDSLENWFKTVNDNQTCIDMVLTKGYDGRWEYDSDMDGGFFPIDDFAHPNNVKYADAFKRMHNFHFTMEMHLQFIYHKGSNQNFVFRGDDDVWIFVNNRLAIDLGGLHQPLADTLEMDKLASSLGLVDEGNYRMDIFFAERQPVNSNFLIRTSLDLRNSEDLYYVDNPLAQGKTEYLIMQRRGAEGLDCGFTPIQTEEEAALVDFYLDGPQFQGQSQLIDPGLHYGGINVDASKSKVTIDSALIKGLATGMYTITFVSTLNKERTGYLTFNVGGLEPGMIYANPLDVHFMGDTTVGLFTNADAKIYYTTDGTAPDTNNPAQLYTDSFVLTKTTTVKAIAIGEKYFPASGSWTYTRDLPDATLEATPGSDTHFGESLEITLTTNADKIFYTTDGSTPDVNKPGQLYSGPFTITSDTIIVKAIAVGAEFNSTSGQWRYISDRIPDIIATPPGCEFTNTITVTLINADPDAVIYYTLDGSEPTINSSKYEQPFTFTSTTQIKARAFADNKVASAILTESYSRISVASGGAYYDKNADGRIDSILVGLDYKATVVPDSLIVINPSNRNDKLVLSSNSLRLSDDSMSISASIEPQFNLSDNTKFNEGFYGSFGDNLFSRDLFAVKDAVAPILISATFTPKLLSADDSLSDIGTLKIVFSENVKSMQGQQILQFSQNGTSYSLVLETISQAGVQAIFNVKRINGADFPNAGDLVNIAPEGEITDDFANVQSNPENRRIALKVDPPKYEIEFKVYPNPFEPDISQIKNVIPGMSISSGVSIIADFRGNLRADAEKIKADIIIYDQLGNVLCRTNREGATSLPVQMGKILSPKTKIVFLWNGYASNGRKAGSGSYLAVISITNPSGIKTTKQLTIGIKTSK